MIDKIISFSVQHRLAVGLAVLIMSAWGAYSLYHLPIDAVPDVTNNQVDVITNCPSLAPLEVERFITAPIEMVMSNIPGLVEIRSVSKFGLSVVKIVFTDDTDVYWARQQVFERLEAVQSEIPQGVGKPAMGPVSTGLGEVYQYIIRPKDPDDQSFTAMEIRTIQDWTVRKKLMGVPGIAEVSSFGGYRKEYQAMLDLERMNALRVTTDEVFDALSRGNSNTGGAYIERNNKAYTIRGIGLAQSLEDIGNTVVKMSGNMPILIRDIANVGFGHSIRQGAMTMDGNGEVVGGVIMMMKGENGNALIGRIKEKMPEIQEALPDGLVIESFIDREKLVSRAIATVSKNLIEGALIVVVVILVFLGNWRASLLAASLIPLSMLFAFGMMQQFGVAGTLMSLGAIDFGLLVDPAIIVVESVVLYLALEMGKKANGAKLTYPERQQVVIHASAQVKQSVVFGGLIILIVYFPLMTLSGIEGKMFIPMAKTVSFAIMGALLLSVTFVPMMSAWILRPEPHGHSLPEKVVEGFYLKVYEPLLRLSLRYKGAILALAVGILVAGVVAFRNIGGEFIPKLAEGDLVIEVNLPVGTSLTEAIRLGDKIQRVLLAEFPDEVEKVVSKIGTSEIPVDPMPLEAQEIVVVLSEKDKWTKAKNQEELAVRVSEVMAQFPGIVISIQQPIENRVNELMSGARTDVVVKLFGQDLDTLVTKGNQIIGILKTVPGAIDVQENKIFGLPQINIVYDRKQMAVHGITVDQVNRAIQMAFAGAVAGIIYENDKRFDLTLRLATDERKKLENIQNLLISNYQNQPVPLREIADIRETIGPAEIGREDLQRRLNIGFNVRGRDLESVVNDAMKQIGQEVILPKGYVLEFGGEFENFRRAKERLAVVVPVSLLVIFGLLYATFGNMKDSLLIYTVVPLSAIGGVFSLLARDMNFSISAGVGFIALFGIAVLNGILLVSQFNNLKFMGMSNPERRVLQGVHGRFRPVLMTSFVAALGFLPMALSTGAGAEVQKPLATVVIGGLFTATLLTLFVLPVLYAIIYRNRTNSPALPPRRGRAKVAAALALLLTAGLIAPFTARAQQKIPLSEALRLALEKNPEMKLAAQKIEQQQALRPAAFNLDAPELIMEAPTGTNMRPGVLQSLPWPGVFTAQSEAQRNRVGLAESEQRIQRNDLTYKVRIAYNQLQFLLQKEDLLRRQDSVFSDILSVNEVRYRVGEISQLEVVNGESQYRRIQYQLSQTRAELRNARIQFGLLLGSPGDTTYLPAEALTRLTPPVALLNDTDTTFNQNPLMEFYLRNQQLNQTLIKVEKRKSLPGLVVGFLDQGDRREGPTPYHLQLRYGLSVPVWRWVYRAQIKAAKIGEEQARTQTQIANYQLSTQFANAVNNYRQATDQLAYFEATGLRQAQEILKSSREGYRLGSISYYAYLQNIDLAFQLEQDYLQTLGQFNQAIIYLNYLKAQP